jgi:phosphonatase-like hydrolase
MSIELVVFDIAGTTVADNGNVNDFFRKAFSNAGIIVGAYDIDQVMGYRKREAVQIILDKYMFGFENNYEIGDTIHEDFTNQMVNFYETCESLVPLPYAEEVFRELQYNKVKVALNTGFTRRITTPILNRLGWDNATFINEVICSDEVPEGRPHPYMIQKLMQKLNITDSENVAKVGDTKVDIEEGKNAGCGLVIAVTTGAYTKEELVQYQPDYLIDSLQILPSLIL